MNETNDIRLQRAIPALRRYSRVLTRDPHRAEDLVQDCLERALTRMHQVRDLSDLRPWLFTIAYRLNISHWRHLKSLVTPPETSSDSIQDATQIPHLEWKEVINAFDRLSDEHRQVLLLVGVEDLEYATVSDILRVPIGTVMSRLSRARDALHRLVDEGERPKLRRIK
ncbi:sigma-70 family RNA polymerase sigma factor [Gluconobacter sphaericus]|uniref:sigma-70 family RNA polymerase sigma factor n=1 Tax=Gluconobacter sphaericus TaxID=574987 RepID=UPI001144AF9B|nr:sigma-70 family RNA polymerase sigma factor [Gluconobacter sphaericus]MBF0886342.1 sigma-70 family RNA polymerase sigma factor [Gluconobacter sphaericus]MBS1097192.1 sigma-70 family RNA polymerase sigma factor [Gluconobacter sphaericus]